MKNDFKSNKVIAIGIIIMVVFSLIFISFGYFIPAILEGNIFSTTGTADLSLDYSYTDLSSGINLSGQYPMDTSTGMKGTPYSFTITNNEVSRTIDYEIIMEVKNGNTLDSSLISTSLGGVLTSGTNVTATTEGYTTGYVIFTDTLEAKKSKTYDLRVWINEDGTLDNAQNKTWVGKIVVKATS